MKKIQLYVGLVFIIIGLILFLIGNFLMSTIPPIVKYEGSYGMIWQRYIYTVIGSLFMVIGIVILFWNQIYKKVKPDLTVRVVR